MSQKVFLYDFNGYLIEIEKKHRDELSPERLEQIKGQISCLNISVYKSLIINMYCDDDIIFFKLLCLYCEKLTLKSILFNMFLTGIAVNAEKINQFICDSIDSVVVGKIKVDMFNDIELLEQIYLGHPSIILTVMKNKTKSICCHLEKKWKMLLYNICLNVYLQKNLIAANEVILTISKYVTDIEETHLTLLIANSHIGLAFLLIKICGQKLRITSDHICHAILTGNLLGLHFILKYADNIKHRSDLLFFIHTLSVLNYEAAKIIYLWVISNVPSIYKRKITKVFDKLYDNGYSIENLLSGKYAYPAIINLADYESLDPSINYSPGSLICVNVTKFDLFLHEYNIYYALAYEIDRTDFTVENPEISSIILILSDYPLYFFKENQADSRFNTLEIVCSLCLDYYDDDQSNKLTSNYFKLCVDSVKSIISQNKKLYARNHEYIMYIIKNKINMILRSDRNAESMIEDKEDIKIDIQSAQIFSPEVEHSSNDNFSEIKSQPHHNPKVDTKTYDEFPSEVYIEPHSRHLPPISPAGNLQHEPLSMHLPPISLAGNLQHEPHSLIIKFNSESLFIDLYNDRKNTEITIVNNQLIIHDKRKITLNIDSNLINLKKKLFLYKYFGVKKEKKDDYHMFSFAIEENIHFCQYKKSIEERHILRIKTYTLEGFIDDIQGNFEFIIIGKTCYHRFFRPNSKCI